MSAALVTQLEDSDTAPLVVTCAASGTDGHNPRAVSIHNHRRLVAQILASRNVALVPRHGSRIFVHPRRSEESAANWLARVLHVILNEVDVFDDCTEVLLEAITQLTGTAVSLARHPHAVANGDLDTDRLLVADADSTWLLQGLPAHADVDPLLATLAVALAQRSRAGEDAVLRELAGAVAAGDARDFVGTVARSCGGQVRLRLATGDIVSEHTTPSSIGTLVQDVVVRSGEAICGSVEIRRAARPVNPEVLTALAGALLSVIQTTRSREELENEVAVLNCLVDLADPASTTTESEARRLVLITAGPATTYWAMTALGARIRSAAEDIPGLKSLAIACTGDRRLIGVYADRGFDVNGHRQTWEQLLAKADPSHQLRAVISTPIRRCEEMRRIVRALERLSEWCAGDGTAFAGRATMADDVGPMWSSLDVWPVDRVGPYVESVLGSLIHDDRFGGELTDTLHAYLQTDGSLRAAAERLHLHSSTVKYRMRIIRDLLGERLTDPEKRFELELALRLHLARRATQKAGVTK